MKIRRKCEVCKKEFFVKPSCVKRGYGRFCSISCGLKNRFKNPLRVKCFCKMCGKKFLAHPSQIRKDGGGSFCSRKCHYEYRKDKQKGFANPNWKGGITPCQTTIYHSDMYLGWRQSCFLRDNFTCQKCKQIGGELEVHHIIPFRVLIMEAKQYLPLLTPYDAAMLYSPLWDIGNGVTLCKMCHRAKGSLCHSRDQNNGMAAIPGVIGVDGVM